MHGRALKRMDANSSAWTHTQMHGRTLTVLTGSNDHGLTDERLNDRMSK